MTDITAWAPEGRGMSKGAFCRVERAKIGIVPYRLTQYDFQRWGSRDICIVYKCENFVARYACSIG